MAIQTTMTAASTVVWWRAAVMAMFATTLKPTNVAMKPVMMATTMTQTPA